MNFRDFLKTQKVIYLDGGLGTLLQQRGLKPGEFPERWNLKRSETIIEIHKSYFDAGANIVNTNTFGANGLKFSKEELNLIISKAVENAKVAAKLSEGRGPKFVALDIGPSGRLLKPYGDYDFEEAVNLFGEVVKIGAKNGVDLVTVETMSDCYETKAAMLAIKENSDLPFIVTNAYGEDEKLMTGASPEAMVALIEAMGADAVGVNCSFGPDKLRPVVERMLKVASIPVVLKPNAGLPKAVNGKTVFDIEADEFALLVANMVDAGVKIVGGCCGTTPEYIRKVAQLTKNKKVSYPKSKNITTISSYTNSVVFGNSPVLIGERLNPTGKKLLKNALLEEDMDYLLKEGIKQEESGAHVLDVNVGIPEVDEVALMPKVVTSLQAIINLPLCIDSSNYDAMEAALRKYNGKPLLNSVNGKKESMERVFPLVKKYGGCVIALTLDEAGIPETADARVEIAKKIIEEAARYGIDKKEIIFDALTMTVSAGPNGAEVTLDAVARIRRELGCHTVLGVSNVSFGLPSRDTINSVFFGAALEIGLSSAILNPGSLLMMKVYHAYNALHRFDPNFENYISFCKTLLLKEKEAAMLMQASEQSGQSPTLRKEATIEASNELQYSIVKGLKEQAARITLEKIQRADSLEIIEKEIIPALNIVGEGFEKKEIYLPQLLMSAEAASAAFDVIKEKMVKSDQWGKSQNRSKVVLATVHGDIHDIGKNIVKLLLQNYGFDVKDLGKDVPPETIVASVVENHAPMVGLSALMTTTVPAMEETIRQLKVAAPWCKIIVGGAVLTKDYSNQIGADAYGKDAMATVRFAESVEGVGDDGETI